MNENAKKAGLIVVIVIAVAAAGYSAYNFMSGDKEQVVKTIPADPNFKSEKQQMLEKQAAGGDAGARDLGGDLSGSVVGGKN